MSAVRELMSRLINLQQLTFAKILAEINALMQRTEEARIYAWLAQTGGYPPRRELTAESTARVVVIKLTTDPPAVVPLLE